MDIKTLTDEKKSAMLAKLCGWEFSDRIMNRNEPPYFRPDSLSDYWISDLYGADYLHWSWLVIEWITQPPKTEVMSHAMINTRFGYWWQGAHLWAGSAEEAQRLWLDKILELAIEAGLVEAA